jgi:hypothetical protein
MKKRRDRKERRYLQEQMSFFVFKNKKRYLGKKKVKKDRDRQKHIRTIPA